jgi:Fe-S cluster biogenesis protein NfuA/nitrite reductase/ring-hydroxylating ferredoxin subunit
MVMDGNGLGSAPVTPLGILIADVAQLEATVESWDGAPRETVRAYRRAIDALHAEALRRLIRGLRGLAGADAALREAATDDVVYAVLRHHGILKPGIAERVEAALDSVRPMLAGHGGDVELVRVEPPSIAVRFTGACDTCPASTLTIDAAVKTAVQSACPEITDIVQVRDGGANRGGDMGHGEDGAWFPAGMVEDVPQGGVRAIALGGRAVILTRTGAAIMCFDDACVHLGAALHGGSVENGVLTCPSHGFRYDLRSGHCETAPEIALPAHEARIVAGRVLVRLRG